MPKKISAPTPAISTDSSQIGMVDAPEQEVELDVLGVLRDEDHEERDPADGGNRPTADVLARALLRLQVSPAHHHAAIFAHWSKLRETPRPWATRRSTRWKIPRLDPRLAAVLALMPSTASPDITSRDALLAEVNTPEARAMYQATTEAMDLSDDENIVPSTGLTVSEHEFVSSPDGNTIKVRVTRPEGNDVRPGVVYLHGGGMQTMSCFDGIYRAWARVIAAQGLAVVMVDFRNALIASSAPEVAPYPAGLHDCVSGVKWVHANATTLGVDPAKFVIAGESGGGNLTLATGMKLLRDGDIGLVRGLFAMCPYIAGLYPDERYPSTVENDGIFLYAAQQPRRDGIRHRGVRREGPTRVAGRSPPRTTSAACRPR